MSLEYPPSSPAKDLNARRTWFVVAIAMVLPSLATWIYFFQAESSSARTQLLVYNGVKAIQFLLPVAWVAGVDKRQLFQRPIAGLQGIGLGSLFGVLVAAATLGLYFGVFRDSTMLAEATGTIRAKITGFGIDTRLKYLGLGVFYSLGHSLLEEYYWRWFVFGQLLRVAALPSAIAASSLGFMAHHVLVLGKFFGFSHWSTWFFSASVAVGGLFWAWLYRKTGSLMGPWLSHLFVDAAIFVVGYLLVRDLLG